MTEAGPIQNKSEAPGTSTHAPALWLAAIYLLCVTSSSLWSIHRYETFQSGWAWDLAHLHQSYWCLANGVETISVRPTNHYAAEGPEPWRSVHLDPIRILAYFLYLVWRTPAALLVTHCVISWLAVFPIARLARGSLDAKEDSWRGVFAAILFILTPVAWPMALNDMRTMQLGIPFVLWATVGFTERRFLLFVTTTLLAFLCRQEYGLAIASLSLLRFEKPTPFRKSILWRFNTALIGLVWLGVYFFYLYKMFGFEAAERYFRIPKTYAHATIADEASCFLKTTWQVALLGGGWTILLLWNKRSLLAAIPLLFVISHRNLTQLLPTNYEWHLIRYASLAISVWIAGGAIGFKTLCGTLQSSVWIKSRLALWAFLLIWIAPTAWLMTQFLRVDTGIASQDVEPLQKVLREIPREAMIWSDNELSAVAADHPHLVSIRFPTTWDKQTVLKSALQENWLLLMKERRSDYVDDMLANKEYETVYDGKSVIVMRKPAPADSKPDGNSPSHR